MQRPTDRVWKGAMLDGSNMDLARCPPELAQEPPTPFRPGKYYTLGHAIAAFLAIEDLDWNNSVGSNGSSMVE
jgi:hypothetical protein